MSIRRLPNLHLLRAFEAAARLQSFSLAAQEISVTPSAISHQLRELEQALGCPLFLRAHRRVSLTAEGRRLQAGLVPLLESLQEVCDSVSGRPAQHNLTLHCAPSFAVKWLAPRLPRFVEANPDITLHLSTGIDRIDLLSRPDVDAVVAFTDDRAEPGVVTEPLGSERFVPLCAPRVAAAIDDLAGQLGKLSLIGSPLSPVQWSDWCRWNGVRGEPVVRYAMDRSALAIAAAVDGMGIALESTLLAEQELAQGELVELPSPSPLPIERVIHYLRYREADRTRGTLRRFRHWLLADRLGHPNGRQASARPAVNRRASPAPGRARR